jgi:hypothetical protein
MRRRLDPKSVHSVVQVQSLKRSIAEAAAARAEAALREAERHHQTGQAALAADETEWLKSVGPGRLALDASRTWALAMLDSSRALVELKRQAQVARDARTEQAAVLGKAIAAEKSVETLANEVTRTVRRRHEERALSESMDAFLRSTRR